MFQTLARGLPPDTDSVLPNPDAPTVATYVLDGLKTTLAMRSGSSRIFTSRPLVQSQSRAGTPLPDVATCTLSGASTMSVTGDGCCTLWSSRPVAMSHTRARPSASPADTSVLSDS